MTRKEAILALRDAVTVGDIDTLPDNCFRRAFAGYPTAGIGFNFSEAHEGSLDAALALHEAVVPDWTWQVDYTPEVLLMPPKSVRHLGWAYGDGMSSGYASRAWLLAILEALIMEADE